MVKVAVIGAGIVGLSSAINVQDLVPGSEVTIIAEAFQNLTSHVAAGIFRPTLELMQGVPAQTARKWIETSWKHYDKLAYSSEAAGAGISVISGYHLWDEGKAYTKSPIMIDEFSYHFKMLTPKELDMFQGHRYQHGCFFTTSQVECQIYIPWLTERFRKQGGKIIKKSLKDLKELCGSYDVVVNCAGLGARHLVNDHLLVPNRGQMFRVKAPWVRHFLYTDGNTWIIPCTDSVVVGGTRQHNEPTTDVRQHESDAIWQRAINALPSLEHAKDKRVVVGLRPSRYPIRVETEIMQFGGKKLQVVHNYGHGGNGIALSWGTAFDAAELVRDLLLKAKY